VREERVSGHWFRGSNENMAHAQHVAAVMDGKRVAGENGLPGLGLPCVVSSR
jgi:hypothetical protein